jgi:cell division protein FtsB
METMPEEEESRSALSGLMQRWFGVLILHIERVLKKSGVRAPRGEYVFWSLAVGLSCVFLWSAVAGPQGAMELFKRRGSLKRLEAENRVLLLRNQALEKEVSLLRNSPEYVEKVAREEFGLIQDGEKVFTFSEAEPADGPGRREEEKGEE